MIVEALGERTKWNQMEPNLNGKEWKPNEKEPNGSQMEAECTHVFRQPSTAALQLGIYAHRYAGQHAGAGAFNLDTSWRTHTAHYNCRIQSTRLGLQMQLTARGSPMLRVHCSAPGTDGRVNQPNLWIRGNEFYHSLLLTTAKFCKLYVWQSDFEILKLNTLAIETACCKLSAVKLSV